MSSVTKNNGRKFYVEISFKCAYHKFRDYLFLRIDIFLLNKINYFYNWTKIDSEQDF